MSKRIKVYLACPLTHAPAEHRARVELLRTHLKRHPSIEVMDFYSLNGGAKEDTAVYEWDIGLCVEKADVVIAECSYPSTGLGWELGVAVEKRCIPTWMFASSAALQTRLLTGAAKSLRNPHLTYDLYDGDKILDVVPIVNKRLSDMLRDGLVD